MLNGIQSHALTMQWSEACFDEKNTRQLLESFFQSLSGCVYEKGYLGHIKGFCQGGDGSFFKISCVSKTAGTSIQGSWNDSCPTVSVTLNIIVTKKLEESIFAQVNGHEIKSLAQEIIAGFARDKNLQIEFKSHPSPEEKSTDERKSPC